jgi:thioredoxin family protein
VRIFLRDQHPDLMDLYLNKGQFRSIPVFVFFDDQFKEIGRFIERPDSVTERRARARQELFAQHPEFGSPDTPVDQLPEEIRVQIMQETTRQREELKPQENRDVVQALREIVSRVA